MTELAGLNLSGLPSPAAMSAGARASLRPHRVLLVGEAEAGLGAEREGAAAGVAVLRSGSAFEALATVMQDAELEAALVDLEAFEPKIAAVAGSLASVRPGLPIYLLCPAHLEPRAASVAASVAGVDYLVTPLTGSDWKRVMGAAGARRAALQPRAGIEPQARDGELADLLDAVNRSIGELVLQSARWASARLGGRAVRVQWGARAESCPAEPGADGFGRLIVDAAGQSLAEVTFAAGVSAGDADAVMCTLARVVMLRQRMAAFRQMAFADPLCGAHNRRYLTLFLDRLIGRAQREGFRLTLLMFDIDDFKKYNDRFGYVVGDEIICDIARLMRQTSRPHDVVSRIGGDEFAVLIWDSGPPRQPGSRHPEQARAVAERFRRALAAHQFKSLGPTARGTLTISGGLASFPADGADAAGLIRVAGERAQAAKKSGKNHITVVGPESAG